MNTLGMVLSIAGLSCCWYPGIAGWIGIAIAFAGSVIGITGLTSIKTKPSAMGMNVASHVFGPLTIIMGMSFQIKHATSTLDWLLLPGSMHSAMLICVGSLLGFIAVQLLGRRWARPLCIGFATGFLLAIAISGTTALTMADRSGIQLITG